ncbi:hypothetical protein H0274_12395 [Altererythrobacter sp. CC-YST694]|uniref:hypothetical protein n=1 Tax=Altererythrobacter sp. CC-YST694 TaxID=2755038 RepID=UPI001D001A4A|nr:hypothetical protein [Altererythrobacter sp. CC-YST694]MCB5426061.1 hypothetical protein [Altererythrobacter sp. CC-YST694]
MSFSNRPMLSNGKKIGCVLYMSLGTLIVLFGLIGAALGDCADIADSSCKDNFGNFLLFPGSLIIVLVGGMVMLWFFTRDAR